MKPFKSFSGLSAWLLRITLAVIIFNTYIQAFSNFNFSSLSFYFAAAFIVFGVLLLIGGLLSKQSLTVVSALFIFLLSVYKTISFFHGGINPMMIMHFTMLTLGFYFFATGNKNR